MGEFHHTSDHYTKSGYKICAYKNIFFSNKQEGAKLE